MKLKIETPLEEQEKDKLKEIILHQMFVIPCETIKLAFAKAIEAGRKREACEVLEQAKEEIGELQAALCKGRFEATMYNLQGGFKDNEL